MANSEATRNILVLGSGGREHAVCRSLARSGRVARIFVAPGNGGTGVEEKCENVQDLKILDFDAVEKFCREKEVTMVFVGPEDPLCAGIADHLKKADIPCFGPSREAAEIEGSKSWAKSFMQRHEIPTAAFRSFDSVEAAKSFIDSECSWDRIVVKASGLAAGKGVMVTETSKEAIEAVEAIMAVRQFGDAGTTVVLEERLEGPEVSVLAFSDGHTLAFLPPSQDHKRLLEGDQGENTGGMGAYAPCDLLFGDALSEVHTKVLQRAADGLRSEGRPFVGVLYAGLMLTPHGPKVLEFNCRLGDPETQVLLPLLTSDLLEVADSCVEGRLSKTNVAFRSDTYCLGIVGVSRGYPGRYAKGETITGLDSIPDDLCAHVCHAGTRRTADGVVLSNGGRVLAVVASGHSVRMAHSRAHKALENVHFESLSYRNDIGKAILHREHTTLAPTYKASGVDIDAGDALVAKIAPLAAATVRHGLRAGVGLFGCIFSAADAGYGDAEFSLVAGTDGVGTKLALAQACGRFEGLGFDLVGMCANDVLCHGAEPLFFLDYYACGRLDPSAAAAVIAGIAEACKEAKCALAGGETAEMPGLYHGKDFDLAGFIVGAAPNSALLPRLTDVGPGDAIIGVASSGLHSNGFSLVRKVAKDLGLQLDAPCSFDASRTWGEALLTPTRLYCRALLPILREGKVKAAAHVTGGGIAGNLERVLPKGCGARIDGSAWTWPKVFDWLASAGGVGEAEMLRSFNCGLGMLLVTSRDDAEAVRAAVGASFDAWQVGVVVAGAREVLVENVRLQRPVREQPMRVKVAVLISGSGTNLQALLDRSLAPSCPFRIALVLSNVPNVLGLERARRAGVETAVVSHRAHPNRESFEMEMLTVLAEHRVQLVALAGFMRILSATFVRKCGGRLLNVHPSLLPAFKGYDAHKQVLKAGVRITGASVHFVTEDVDAGAIIAQGSCPVLLGDDEASLSERVKTEVEHRIFPDALEAVSRGDCRFEKEKNRVVWRQEGDALEELAVIV